MPQSCNVTAVMIKELRNRTGAGMQECASALKHCKGDELLAEGWLKYYGCAVNTYDTPHEQWAMERAQEYKDSVLRDPANRTPHHLDSLQNQ